MLLKIFYKGKYLVVRTDNDSERSLEFPGFSEANYDFPEEQRENLINKEFEKILGITIDELVLIEVFTDWEYPLGHYIYVGNISSGVPSEIKYKNIYWKKLEDIDDAELNIYGLQVYQKLSECTYCRALHSKKDKLDDFFDRYISTKSELRRTTYTNYTYMYDYFVRDGFGKKKVGDIKYSDVLHFYHDLIHNKGIQINTLDAIHTVLHPTFQLAVRDGIIRMNPSDGVMAELKKKTGNKKGIRHTLTLEQQRAFMNYIAGSPVFVGWLPFFTVLLGTGCRIGEVVGLRWQDMDLKERTININNAMTYYPRHDDTYKCELKVSLHVDFKKLPPTR